jgi:hypothetical protein
MDAVLPRWMVRTLVASATAMVILGVYGFHILGLKADWIAFYAAGSFLTQGKLGQLYDPAIIQAWEAPHIGSNIVRFLYPPAFSLLFVPLILLPLEAARLSWLVVGLAAGLGAAWMNKPWSQLSFHLRALVLLAFPPLAYSLVAGQISPITLLVFSLLAVLEWRGEHDSLPGIVAGLVIYKPQLLIPLIFFWLVRRRWLSLGGLLLAVIGIGLLSSILSWPATLAYLRLSLDFLVLAQTANTSGANASLFALNPWLGSAVGCGVLLVLFFAARRAEMRYSYVLLWLAPVLVTPYIVIYDFLLLVLPVFFLVPILLKDRLILVFTGILWALSLLAIVLLNTRLVTLAALGLFILVAWRAYQNEADPGSPELNHSVIELPSH